MPDGSPPLATCARDGCGERFAPRNTAARFCSTVCREKASTRARRATPEGRRTQAIRYALWYADNASYQCWTAVLRRKHALRTPQRVAVVGTLRGKGHVDPEVVRAALAAAGCPWPEAARTPPSRRRTEALVAPAPVAPLPAPRPATPDGLWARPSPEAPPLLPCAALVLRTVSEVSPSGDRGRVPVRHLHAALTALHGCAHSGARPGWRLSARASDVFDVVWHDASVAERLRATSTEVRLGDRVEPMAWGSMLHRPRAPSRLEAGAYRVTVAVREAVSFSRSGHREAVTSPTAATVTSACLSLLAAAGVEHDRGVEVRSVSPHTLPTAVDLGGHTQRGSTARGEVIALRGRIVVECNAVAAWALRLAEVYGLGGMTAFGLGAVRVSVVAL